MLSATGIIELDRFSSAFTQLGREVLDTSTKFLRIMDMASVELGGYELRSAPDSIYVTDNFFDLLGMPGVDADDLTAQSFRELLQRFERSCPHSLAPDGAMLYHIRLPTAVPSTASAPSSSAHPKNSATRRFCCSTSTTSSR